jgi:hypothetical protein
MRSWLRILSDEPISILPSTEAPAPTRAELVRETPEPARVKARRLIPEPSAVNASTDIRLPNLPADLTEQLDPRWQLLSTDICPARRAFPEADKLDPTRLQFRIDSDDPRHSWFTMEHLDPNLAVDRTDNALPTFTA